MYKTMLFLSKKDTLKICKYKLKELSLHLLNNFHNVLQNCLFSQKLGIFPVLIQICNFTNKRLSHFFTV